MPVLTAIDILRVQRYIFASRHLKDVVSASWIVEWATSEDGVLKKHRDRVIYAGGANAILEFESFEEARQFAGKYTRKLLEEAPGLEVILVHREFTAGGLAAAFQTIQVDLARAKLERTPSAEQLGLGVTARCAITSLPANDYIQEVPLARMVSRWREEEEVCAARSRWKKFLPESVDGTFEFPLEIDQMGRSRGDTSLLGVVHLDGNGTGERIREWLQDCIDNRTGDDEVKRHYREWSGALQRAVEDIFKKVVNRVHSAVNNGEVRSSIANMAFRLYVDDESEKRFLPLRPVILGGDDLTFVCDGRIALDLATAALRYFQEKKIPHLGQLSASAGIAMVRAHYPFARAYKIAEGLCVRAKAERRKLNDKGSWIDWHIGAIRPGESINDVRNRAYTVSVGGELKQLTCRPYRLEPGKDDVESWRWLCETVLDSNDQGLRQGPWQNSKNKVKELIAVVREGPEAVGKALQAWQVANPALCFPEKLGVNGYLHLERTPLIDAVELYDIHFPLAPAVEGVIS